MKRTRIVTVALLVSFVLLGVGYGLWSTPVTINNTVKTAKFDVVFVGIPTVTQSANMNVTANNPGSNKLNYNFNGIYPGSLATITQSAQNTGTIPVKLNSVVLSPVVDDKGLDAQRILVHEVVLQHLSVSNTVSDYRVVTLVNDSGQLRDTLLKWNDGQPLVLGPNESLSIRYKVRWPSENSNAVDNLYKGATVSYSLTLGYSQL